MPVFCFLAFQELPKVSPRNFNIFIRIDKKSGEDTTKNYTDLTAPAARNNFQNYNNNFKNQDKNYQTKYKYFENIIKAGEDTIKK